MLKVIHKQEKIDYLPVTENCSSSEIKIMEMQKKYGIIKEVGWYRYS